MAPVRPSTAASSGKNSSRASAPGRGKNSSKASSSTAKSKAPSAKNQRAGAAEQTCGPASASFLQKLAAKRERELEGFVDKEVFAEKKLRQVVVRGFPVTILTEGGRPTVDRLLREVKEEPASQQDDGATQPATSPTTSNPFAGSVYEDEFMEEVDNEHIADEEHQNKRNEVYRIDGTRTDDGMHIQVHTFCLRCMSIDPASDCRCCPSPQKLFLFRFSIKKSSSPGTRTSRRV